MSLREIAVIGDRFMQPDAFVQALEPVVSELAKSSTAAPPG